MTSEAPAARSIQLPLIGSISEERAETIWICMMLATLVFAVYWITGPRETDYSYQTSQANNMLHGHLDFLPQYTRNLDVLERVMYDGKGFCFPPDDPQAIYVSEPRFSENCKIYMQHSLGPAFIVLPLVAIFGVYLNQTLISVMFGAMTAPVVFLISRAFSKKLPNQLLLTGLMMFGTIFWWVAANGGVWFFAHTTATFFLFCAIYFAINRPNPLLAGALLGAAFMCRPTTLMTGLFFVVIFLPLWLHPPTDERPSWHISLQPIANFVAGISPFLLLGMAVNYARFDDPLENGYKYGEQFHQDFLHSTFNRGTFSIDYVTRHPPVLFEQMPVFNEPGRLCSFRPRLDCAPVRTAWYGMAIWATTPIFLATMFTGITNRWVSRIGAALIALACGIIFSRAFVQIWHKGWQTQEIPLGIHLLPFWLMIAAAVFFALRHQDRLVAACWAAIIPTATLIFTFAATGWAQFGYRYALDFTPFLWLLVARFIGDDLKWWHVALIAAGVAVNVMGVFWVYQFEPSHVNDWVWVACDSMGLRRC